MIQFTRTEHYPHIALDAAVGYLPYFWDPADPRPAIEQHDSKPSGGGPWSHFNGFTISPSGALRYPGDEDLLPLAKAELPLTSETIFVYPHAWVAIVQADGTFTVDRRD